MKKPIPKKYSFEISHVLSEGAMLARRSDGVGFQWPLGHNYQNGGGGDFIVTFIEAIKAKKVKVVK